MDVIEFLNDLVNIPSISGEEKVVAERVKNEFRKLGFDEIIESSGNVCARKGNGPVKILYDAHMDVVEPGKGWISDPFKARIDGGYIYGRGSCDDKGSLAAIVYGGSQVEVEDVTLYVVGSTREEIAEGNGLKDFFNDTGIKPDYIVIAEPSSLRLAFGNRGRLGIEIVLKGQAGHASNPDLGKNAIYKAATVIKDIQRLNLSLESDSVAVTKVSTPNNNINIIPEACSIKCDYRAGYGREKEEIISKFRKFLEKEDRILTNTPYYKPWKMENNDPFISAGKACLQEALGNAVMIEWGFCTNGSYTAGELGIPTMGFGPGCEEEAHSAEEKIEIESVIKAVEFFRALPGYVAGIVNV